jgi:hypothetical protein
MHEHAALAVVARDTHLIERAAVPPAGVAHTRRAGHQGIKTPTHAGSVATSGQHAHQAQETAIRRWRQLSSQAQARRTQVR